MSVIMILGVFHCFQDELQRAITMNWDLLFHFIGLYRRSRGQKQVSIGLVLVVVGETNNAVLSLSTHCSSSRGAARSTRCSRSTLPS